MKNGKYRQNRGFSLLELLFVVTIIGIVAGLTIPNLVSSKKAGHETVAISYLRALSDTQEIFKMKKGGYASDPTQLASEGLINDPDVYAYSFSLGSTPGAQGKWWGSASPKDPGTTGDRYFFIDITGVIRVSNSGPADVNSPPL
jgi:prepilin-type N-terminal cleavage/methylation domain-containing protein